MTKLRKHQEQFKRMKRWYERIKKIDQGMPHNLSFINLPSGYFYDEFYAFFVNCYHLRDWIENDDTVKPLELEKKVEHFMKQNKCMCVCRDICIGIKHLEQKSSTWSGQVPKFKRRELSLSLVGGPKPIINVKFYIETKTGTIDAFELASECVRKWGEFIKDNIN